LGSISYACILMAMFNSCTLPAQSIDNAWNMLAQTHECKELCSKIDYTSKERTRLPWDCYVLID
jgi:hypothetical protein